jgi:hypothetical protein
MVEGGGWFIKMANPSVALKIRDGIERTSKSRPELLRKSRLKALEEGCERIIFKGFRPLESLALYLHIFVSA